MTHPAPVNLEPPSLCLFFSFLFAVLSLKEDKVGDGASGGGLVADF